MENVHTDVRVKRVKKGPPILKKLKGLNDFLL